MRRFCAAVALGLLALVALPLTAHADEDDWAIPRYAVTAVAAADGTVDVTLDFDFDFAGTPGHGPYVTLPVRQEISGDPDHYRSFTVTDVTAASPTGAPAQVETDTEDGALSIRVGDEDVEVDGVQTYRVGYRIRGVVNPGAGTADADEIFWNVVGSQWEVPLSDVTVALSGPTAVDRAACFAGESGSDQACGGASVAGDTVTYTQDAVEPGSGLTVVAAWPAGTFVGAEPVLVPRRNPGNTFALTPLTGGTAGVVTLLGVGALLQHARRRGRDRAYTGLTPGLTPSGTAADAATTARGRTPVAVQFTPPEDVRPGELGTVVDEVAHTHDVTATIVDLAVRGHLRIEETTPAAEPQGGRTPKAKDRRWRLVRRTDAPTEPLRGYEQLLLDGLFTDRTAVDLDDLGESFADTLTVVRAELTVEVTDRGWFTANPSRVRTRWYGIGGGLIALGAVLALVLALTTGWGLVGVAVVVVGVAALLLARAMPARTAAGSAVLAQALGFRSYLSTAEGDQLRFEEGEDIFSRYLPYAIAFGVAERWARVFADLAARGRSVPEPTWYVGAHPTLFFAAGSGFGDSLGAFSQAAAASMTAATAGSSGGSGFSGGYAGGGAGGGGGGGW